MFLPSTDIFLPSSNQQLSVRKPELIAKEDGHTNCDFYLSSARGSRREGPGIAADIWDPERPGGRTKQLRPHGEIKETRKGKGGRGEK